MQDISGAGEEQAHLIGQEGAVGGAFAGQVVLDHFDEVLVLPARAVQIAVDALGTGQVQGGDDEAEGEKAGRKRGRAHFLLNLRPLPRRTRIHIDGLPLHIVQRGHNRAACFFDDQDRRADLGWLYEARVGERCRLHANVLMTNPVHLLLTPEEAVRVPQVLISVGRRYVQSVNHTDGRTGTLWDGRNNSSLVQAEPDLALYHRDVELNPVRAGMVADPPFTAGPATGPTRSARRTCC